MKNKWSILRAIVGLCWLTAFVGIHAGALLSAYAGEILMTASAGYDSNPAKDERAEGTGFTRYSLGYNREFFPVKDLSLTVEPTVVYQNLWEMKDNHQIGFTAFIRPQSGDRRVSPYMFGSAFFYRDALIETDERDELEIGVGANWLVSNRTTLSFDHAWNWISYLSGSVPFAHGNRYGNQKKSNGETDDQHTINSPQENIGAAATLAIEVFVRPTLTASAGVAVERLNSSMDGESFWQIAPKANLAWDMAQSWRLMSNVEGQRIVYDADQKQKLNIRKINDTLSMEIRLSRFWKHVEAFASFFIAYGEHPLNYETYHQREAQCGVSWSY